MSFRLYVRSSQSSRSFASRWLFNLSISANAHEGHMVKHERAQRRTSKLAHSSIVSMGSQQLTEPKYHIMHLNKRDGHVAIHAECEIEWLRYHINAIHLECVSISTIDISMPEISALTSSHHQVIYRVKMFLSIFNPSAASIRSHLRPQPLLCCVFCSRLQHHSSIKWTLSIKLNVKQSTIAQM